LCIACQCVYGQRRIRSYDNIKEAVQKGDSLEVLYVNDSLLNSRTDTLLIYSESENWKDILREIRLITYYYDNTNNLKKISYKNGSEGYYYFYFEGIYLRKIRVEKKYGLINAQYYYRIRDNQVSDELSKKWADESDNPEFYQLLLKAIELFNKFKSGQLKIDTL
jgi:hypothetical protein